MDNIQVFLLSEDKSCHSSKSHQSPRQSHHNISSLKKWILLEKVWKRCSDMSLGKKIYYLFAWRTFIVSAGSRSCSFRAVVVRSDGLLNITQGLRVLVYLKDRTLCWSRKIRKTKYEDQLELDITPDCSKWHRQHTACWSHPSTLLLNRSKLKHLC